MKTAYVVTAREIQCLLLALMEMDGDWKVQAFGCTEKAYAAFQAAERPPDLLITGYIVNSRVDGTRNGLQLMKDCKQLVPELHTVLATSRSCQEIVDILPTARAIADGVLLWDDYPSPHQIVTTLRQAVGLPTQASTVAA
jgi:DNA-binding NarL/FixJ family response regulator